MIERRVIWGREARGFLGINKIQFIEVGGDYIYFVILHQAAGL